ncbi:ADP-ribosylglycohydrolase family protein [Niastella caeni]|uniref:ADP-ribosylglycohydrolase family protein n=1 Tax=Niastella caeni TaxID=2569763 RepID=UPI001AA05D7F|nr:ADP-ribosylglycohydrolase family protein [Niastella caeni]
MKTNLVHGALFGVVIGDALGVPAEFKSRGVLQLVEAIPEKWRNEIKKSKYINGLCDRLSVAMGL